MIFVWRKREEEASFFDVRLHGGHPGGEAGSTYLGSGNPFAITHSI
jgi:hypothetical protein